MRRTMLSMALALVVAAMLALAGPAAAHVHTVSTPHHDQILANGQNHPSFGPVDGSGLRNSCEGTLEPADSGPASYGLETAHHGPDAGSPGKDDGCYATVGNPQDSNPAID